MTKCFNKFKKPYFWPIFGPFSDFRAKTFFPENPALSCTTSYGFLASCQNSEKTNDTTISRKRLGRRTDGRTKGRTDPILQDSSGYRRGSNNEFITTRKFYIRTLNLDLNQGNIMYISQFQQNCRLLPLLKLQTHTREGGHF